MKKLFKVLILLSLCHSTYAQEKSYHEINEQVWVPFIDAFNERDQKALSKVHSKEFIRVIRDSQSIFGFERAFTESADSTRANLAKWEINLELRFTERIASAKEAFEVGYYKTSYENRISGEQSASYGKFHVLLRKEKDKWKVMMDADGTLGVTDSLFQSAKKMEEFF